MVLPWRVGVIPGDSVDEADDGHVSALEDELTELTLFFATPVPISFRGIDFDVPPESTLETGMDRFDSSDFRGSSSLDLESCEDWGVPALSEPADGFGELLLGILADASLRCEAVGRLPEADLDKFSLKGASDWESFLKGPFLLPFGTSPSRNLSLDVWFFSFPFTEGEWAC
jgi:hypothetical protein